MVSIILTTYNRAKLLPRAIESVLAQSDKDFELIIVDDCSTDNTKRVVKNYCNDDKRIRLITLHKNHGSDSYPKNVAIQEAKGEYICFLDDDDMYRRDAVKILRKYIESSGADAVYGDYLNNTLEGKKEIGWSTDFNPSVLARMNYISMGVIMLKRAAVVSVGGFDEMIPKFKDWNLWLRMQKRGYKFMHVPIIVLEVFQQRESVSNKYKVKSGPNGEYYPILLREDGTEWELFNPADCKIWPQQTLFGGEQPLKVALFTLTMDRLDYTKRMTESLKRAGYHYDWYVIDQASKDGTVEWLKSYTPAIVIENKENVGIAKGWNQAIDEINKAGKYDIIIKIDNDCEMMSENWLAFMVDLYDRNRTMILSPYVEGLEDSPGGVLRQRADGKEPYAYIHDRVLGKVPNLGGICFAAPVELYENFRFEEAQFLAGNKDYMLSQYARSIGMALFYCEELRCWHIDGTKGQHEKYPEYFAENYDQKVYEPKK